MHICGVLVHVDQGDYYTGPDSVRVRVVLDVCDVSTGEDTYIVQNSVLPRAHLVDGKVPAALIRHQIALALMHELDECLYIDGVQLKDPHGMPPGFVFTPTRVNP